RERPAEQSLGETLIKERASPRDCPGGSAGDGKSPRKVWRGTTAHTLYVFEWRRPAILYYGEITLNCGEHYRAAIGQSRNVHYSGQCHSAIFLHCTRKFSATGIEPSGPIAYLHAAPVQRRIRMCCASQ